MPGVLCAGNILDVLARPIAREVAWQATTWIEEIVQRVGGNAANSSVALAKMGIAVRDSGPVGRDPFAEFALSYLSEAGVDCSVVERVALATGATSVLVREDGARALLHCPGEHGGAGEGNCLSGGRDASAPGQSVFAAFVPRASGGDFAAGAIGGSVDVARHGTRRTGGMDGGDRPVPGASGRAAGE